MSDYSHLHALEAELLTHVPNTRPGRALATRALGAVIYSRRNDRPIPSAAQIRALRDDELMVVGNFGPRCLKLWRATFGQPPAVELPTPARVLAVWDRDPDGWVLYQPATGAVKAVA